MDEARTMSKMKKWTMRLNVAAGAFVVTGALAVSPARVSAEPDQGQGDTEASKGTQQLPLETLPSTSLYRARPLLTPEEIAKRTLTKNKISVEGILHRLDDGMVFLAVPLDPKADKADLLKRGVLRKAQLRGAPAGTYLRYFTVAPGGPTDPMLKRRLGTHVKLSLVQEKSGGWLVEDVTSTTTEP